MLLAHRIRLDPTRAQRDYFTRAAGTARRVWNWALAEWLRQREAGGKPNAMALKKQFNAIKYSHPDWHDEEGKPWLRTMHRDSHAQPFAHLARAWSRFFEQIKSGVQAHAPRFKKKGRCPDSFYVANDKFRLEAGCIVLPKLGRVKVREALRFDGKPTLDTGEQIVSPRPLKSALRRLRIRSRRASRKFNAARKQAGIAAAMPKGTRVPVSNNRRKEQQGLGRLHARIAAVRSDFTHKLTTRLCRENQTVVVEDLCVKGMLGNAKLARSISDIGFGRIRAQLAYKAERYGTTLIVADRWYPSSKLCSSCGVRHAGLVLSERHRSCDACGAHHQRDHNAALNLRRLATGVAGHCSQTALPVASRTVTDGTACSPWRHAGGEVTPVRHEHGQQDGSGQEVKVHNCAPFR